MDIKDFLDLSTLCNELRTNFNVNEQGEKFLMGDIVKLNVKKEKPYNSAQNRAFKTTARELYAHSNVEGFVDRDFASLQAEEDCYAGKDSGFSLSCIDGLLLGVYEYSPMGRSSYLPLPESIQIRKAVVNSQNIDRQCFKWAILAKHVSSNRTRVGVNYLSKEHRYDFSALSTSVRRLRSPITENGPEARHEHHNDIRSPSNELRVPCCRGGGGTDRVVRRVRHSAGAGHFPWFSD
ncbi:hypothetical protein QTP88_015529 [Uroleucon formosanum]